LTAVLPTNFKKLEGFEGGKQLSRGSESLLAAFLYIYIERFVRLKDVERRRKLIELLTSLATNQKGSKLTCTAYILSIVENVFEIEDPNVAMAEFESTITLINLRNVVTELICKRLRKDTPPEIYSFQCSDISALTTFAKLFSVELGLFLLDNGCYERLEVYSPFAGQVLNAYMDESSSEGVVVGVLYHWIELEAYTGRLIDLRLQLDPETQLKRYPFECVPAMDKEYSSSYIALEGDGFTKRHSLVHEVYNCQLCFESKERNKMFTEIRCSCRLCNQCTVMSYKSGENNCPKCPEERPLDDHEVAVIETLMLSMSDLPMGDLSMSSIHSPTSSVNASNDDPKPLKGSAAKQVDSERICKICYDKPFAAAFMPCGHVICEGCSKKMTKCPYCKQRVGGVLKLHI